MVDIPSNIPPQFRSKYENIAGMITAFCDEHLDEEFADLSLHALQKLCRKRTEPMASGRDNMWAAGIDYVISQNCNAIGNNGDMLLGRPKYRLKADDFCDGFGVSKGGVAEKAKTISKELGITQGKEEWLIPSMREGAEVVKAFNRVLRGRR